MANSYEWRIETEAAVRGLGTVSQILLWFTQYAAFLTLVLELNCSFMRPTALRLEGILVLILGQLPRSTGETAAQTLVVGRGRQALAGQAEWSRARLLTPGPLIWLLPPAFVTITKGILCSNKEEQSSKTWMTRDTRRRGHTVCFHPNEVLEKAKPSKR